MELIDQSENDKEVYSYNACAVSQEVFETYWRNLYKNLDPKVRDLRFHVEYHLRDYINNGNN